MGDKVKGQRRQLVMPAVLVGVVLATATSLKAQDTIVVSDHPWKIASGYLDIQFMKPLSPGGGGCSGDANVFFRNGLGMSAGIRYAAFRAGVPGDYMGPSGSFSNDDGVPRDFYTAYTIRAAWKFYPARHSNQARLSIEAGTAFIYYDKNFYAPQPVTSSGGLFPSRSSNYSYHRDAVRTTGIDLTLRAEIVVNRGIGFSLGSWMQRSSVITQYGFEFGFLFGITRESPHYREHYIEQS
jgi:hypothetical protein